MRPSLRSAHRCGDSCVRRSGKARHAVAPSRHAAGPVPGGRCAGLRAGPRRRRNPAGVLPRRRAPHPGRTDRHGRGLTEPLRPGLEPADSRGSDLRPAQRLRRSLRGLPRRPRKPGRVRRGGGHRPGNDPAVDRPPGEGDVRLQVRARRRRRRDRTQRPRRVGAARAGCGPRHRARPDPAGARLPEVGRRRAREGGPADGGAAPGHRRRRPRRRPYGMAAGPSAVRTAGGGVRRLRGRGRPDQRNGRGTARRGRRQGLHRLPPHRVRVVARTARRPAAHPGGGTAQGSDRTAGQLVAVPYGPGPARSARTRNPGEHRAVRADRPDRLRSVSYTHRDRSRLRPLLTTRYADLPGLDRDLDSARHTLDGFRHGGRWTALPTLARAQRERIDSVFGDLVERLASVATLCDPRRTA